MVVAFDLSCNFSQKTARGWSLLKARLGWTSTMASFLMCLVLGLGGLESWRLTQPLSFHTASLASQYWLVAIGWVREKVGVSHSWEGIFYH